ncbi:MAG: UDPGP type 1 family protein [Caldithrix sp.]|nr:UDPGP type 1 family protein [Caldithrix sp.]
MIQTDNKDRQKKIKLLYEHGQGHVFRFWDELKADEREQLLQQVESIDMELMAKLINQYDTQGGDAQKYPTLEPVPVTTLGDRQGRDDEMKKIGENALKNGQVAAFLVAGGQGSRLGFDGPKGKFQVTPIQKKSLFQLHAEKIRRMEHKYNTVIPWYIMTSKTNHKETVEYFEQNKYFGYDSQNIMFFSQDMIPAINRKGKFFLVDKHTIFENPNGHGGSLKALWESGAISDMKDRGIDYIFYFQVDNVLTRICDPIYLGYHIDHQAEMSNKVLRKAYPEEKMGVICRINGKIGVVEYSDLSEEDMYARKKDGSLKYWAGSIATHMFNVNFIEKENKDGFKLPYHIAEKKIDHLDENGHHVQPEGKNGIKFETFVFDALPDADTVFNLEVSREKEFSALKNSEGDNSPQTVKNDLLKMYARMLKRVGRKIETDDQGIPQLELEISPLFAIDEDDMTQMEKQIPEQINHKTYIE